MKQYTKPEIHVLEIKCCGVLATSGLKYSNDEASTEHEVLSGKRRGEWGDIWN